MTSDKINLKCSAFPKYNQKYNFSTLFPFDILKKKKSVLSNFNSGLAEGQTDWYEQLPTLAT